MTREARKSCETSFMKTPNTRREFLTEGGRGMVVASVGYSVATELGLSTALASDANDRLTFGSIEPLVGLMQDTPVDQLPTKLVSQLQSGVPSQRLVQAAALANARTFGGEDYVGFHTMMGSRPGPHMSP